MLHNLRIKEINRHLLYVVLVVGDITGIEYCAQGDEAQKCIQMINNNSGKNYLRYLDSSGYFQ